MIVTAYKHPDADVLRFVTERGSVVALVRPIADGTADVEIYEEAACRSCGDEATWALARNRFGTGLMLRITREIVRRFPLVTTWAWERMGGVRPFSPRMMEV